MHNRTERMSSPARIIGKVAAVTLAFWIMKMLATTLGETTSDFVSMTLPRLYLRFTITVTALVVILFFQIRAPRYSPVTRDHGDHDRRHGNFRYDRPAFGLGYARGSTLFVAGLMASLVVWYARARSLVVYSIPRRDVEVLFWLAYVFTCPFGATFGGLLTKPLAKGGMNLPRSAASIVTLRLLVSSWSCRRFLLGGLAPHCSGGLRLREPDGGADLTPSGGRAFDELVAPHSFMTNKRERRLMPPIARTPAWVTPCRQA